MRPVSDLEKLNSAISARLRRLRRLYNVGVAPATERVELIPFTVIELDNLVLSAMRVLLIRSVRNARTLSGVRVASSFHRPDEDEIAAFTLSVLNVAAFTNLGAPVRINRKKEPTIRDPRDLERIFSAAGLTNAPSLQNALALNASLFTNLATLRNFYAHRNENTWRKARRKAIDMGLAAPRNADDIVKAMVPGRAVRVYENWLDEAELFFEQACG